MEPTREFVELFRTADGINLHAAIVLITNPTREPDLPGVVLNEPAVSHSLHTT